MTKGRTLMAAALLGTTALASTANATQWTGYYIGVSGGYTESNTRYEDLDYSANGATQDWFTDGLGIGVQIGHNWQNKNTVYGVELDFSGFGVEDQRIYSGNQGIENELNWLGSLRARSGFGTGQVFFYQTLGLAVGDFDGHWIVFGDPANSWSDHGDTKAGLIGGFGVEGMIDGNWSVRAEFLASRFFDNSVTTQNLEDLSVDQSVYTIRAGINYAFGGAQDGAHTFEDGKPFDFSGFYVGALLGGSSSTVQSTDIEYDWFGGTHDFADEGFSGGVQLGFNRQINAFVYGLEASFTFLDGDFSHTDTFSRFVDGGLNWTGSLVLKTGMAVDNSLMYIFGGYSYGDYDLTDRNSGTPDIWDLGGGHSGFVVGTGIERALTPNLTFKVEAAYSGFDGDTERAPTDADLFRGAAQNVSVMAGLNYYFGERGGWGTGALPAANWKGFFVGLDGLFAYHHGDITDQDYYEWGGTYTVPSFGGGAGVNIGYNWQKGSFVYGLVGDIAFLSNDEEDTSVNYREMVSSIDWQATLRGRAGLASGDAFMYATAGIAWAGADLEHNYLPAPDDESFAIDDTRFGWVAGLGVEKKIGEKLSLKMEALYTSYGEEQGTNPDQDNCGGSGPNGLCVMNGKDSNITVKAGITYHLGAE